MTTDLIRELQQIQRYAAGLHDLLAKAKAQAPRQAEGTDRSGAVRVVLGPDGFPETIRVDGGWQRRLSAAAFGGAVGEAFSAATGDRLAAWTTTLRQQGGRPASTGCAATSTGAGRRQAPRHRRCGAGCARCGPARSTRWPRT